VKTAVIYDEIFLKHDLPSHPENALRLKYFLKSLPEFKIPVLKPKQVSYDILRAVHSENYIEDVRISCRENAPGFFDPDTYYGSSSFDVALMAAGAVEMGVELLLSGELCSVFCAVRPPGHHAEKDRAMGFCIFNNIAVGAVKALSLGAKRIFIVDFDAHHGNGTQHAFENVPEVFYFSTHQYPFYPGTGSKEENKNNILNFPMKEGTGDTEFKKVYGEIYRRAMKTFGPDIILVSAGYDLHRDDPLTGLEVTDMGVEFIVEQILESAEELKIPVLFSLEGGYNLCALERCGRITFKKLVEFS
jgi:acetoin utilization deacetylase AcuC-like enzyme